MRESYLRYGPVEQNVFIVQELEDESYDVIEGNHRLIVWRENKYAGIFLCV